MNTYSLIMFITVAIEVYTWIIIARCILSFIPHDPRQTIIRFIYEITDPVLKPFQRVVPLVSGIDFSPLVALLALQFLRYVIVLLLSSF